MKFPVTLAAQAAAVSALAMKRDTSRVLISNPGNIFLADYDGSSFTTTLSQPVSGNPTWMAFVKPDRLYAVNEDGSDTRVFPLDVANSQLGQESAQQGSSGVVHLAFSKDGSRMIGAGFGSANVDVWDVSDGGLSLVKTIPSGNSPSNPHQAVLDPTGRFFVVNDLGADQVFAIDSKDDAYEIISRSPVTPSGCGPRHGAFWPVGAEKASHYLLLCEPGNLVITFDVSYADDKIALNNPQSHSTFGPNPTPEGAAAGELVLGPDGKDLYVSNRITGADTDTIAHFRLASGDDGALSVDFVAETSTGGQRPRMFSISTDGKDLFVGNEQGALGIVALGRAEDGTLEEKPRASIPMSQFSAGGPKYVQQIA